MDTWPAVNGIDFVGKYKLETKIYKRGNAIIVVVYHLTMQTFLEPFQTCVEADGHDFHRLS